MRLLMQLKKMIHHRLKANRMVNSALGIASLVVMSGVLVMASTTVEPHLKTVNEIKVNIAVEGHIEPVKDLRYEDLRDETYKSVTSMLKANNIAVADKSDKTLTVSLYHRKGEPCEDGSAWYAVSIVVEMWEKMCRERQKSDDVLSCEIIEATTWSENVVLLTREDELKDRFLDAVDGLIEQFTGDVNAAKYYAKKKIEGESHKR